MMGQGAVIYSALRDNTTESGEVICNEESKGLGQMTKSLIYTTEVPNLENGCQTSLVDQVAYKLGSGEVVSDTYTEILSFTQGQ